MHTDIMYWIMFNLQIIGVSTSAGGDKTKAKRKRSIERTLSMANSGFYYMIYVKSAQTFAGVPIKHPSTTIHTEEKLQLLMIFGIQANGFFEQFGLIPKTIEFESYFNLSTVYRLVYRLAIIISTDKL